MLLLKRIILLTSIAALLNACSENSASKEAGEIISRDSGKITTTGYWIPDKAEELIDREMGPFVRLQDGSLLNVQYNKSRISRDEGKTWTEYIIIPDTAKYVITPAEPLIQTSKGIIILAFQNAKETVYKWDTAILDAPGAKLPTYTIRSLDGGKTWRDFQKLHDEWTGANRDIIETRDGNVIFTSMMLRHNPGHNTVLTYTTKDQGKTWIRSNIIDLGGVGNHSGVMEPSIIQLKDGRIWMLIRTNWGKFWEAYSNDEGLSWKNIKPTTIDASTAPGALKRLQSGRIVLVWNRLYPEGKKDYPLRGGDGQFTEVPVSTHRDELSMMFSDDEGRSWTDPVVIARVTKEKAQLSYPYIFEVQPGELWITTQFAGKLAIRVNEKDFIQ